MERNLRLIPLHQALTGALVWFPIFVLFTRVRFDLDGAVLLAALYDLLVVVLEVPSGTDVSFHYDSLEAVGRADTYSHRQAR